ncbi:hypothetical protein GGR50DRAFT_368741 [Xylaria sp. CBS 124048]|nr:hypothetical protein GGR50DRAFT_368741 [Xylaria sp. CBS 124048]
MSASKGFAWTGPAHEALVVAFSRIHGPVKPEEQVALVADMKTSGFETTWEGISPFPPFPFQHNSINPFLHISFSQRIPPNNYANIVANMPPSTPKKKWDDTMNSHLFLAISYALDISFTQENKDEIVAIMNERFGYDVNWNGIR